MVQEEPKARDIHAELKAHLNDMAGGGTHGRLAAPDLQLGRLYALIGKLVEQGLDRHALALTESAKASDKYAASLVTATRWLVAATVALFVAAVAQVVAIVRAG